MPRKTIDKDSNPKTYPAVAFAAKPYKQPLTIKCVCELR